MSTILIVEDSAGRRELCSAIRESGRFDRVVEAGNAIEGLELLLSEDVDMVLCDLEEVEPERYVHTGRRALMEHLEATLGRGREQYGHLEFRSYRHKR